MSLLLVGQVGFDVPQDMILSCFRTETLCIAAYGAAYGFSLSFLLSFHLPFALPPLFQDLQNQGYKNVGHVGVEMSVQVRALGVSLY